MGFSMEVELASIASYIVSRHGKFRYLELNEIQTLDQWAGDIVEKIEEEWPVDTSTSRDAFSYTLMTGGRVGFTITNDVDYVQYIHAAGTGPESALVDTLIPEIVQDYTSGLLVAMRAAVEVAELVLAARAPAPARRPRGRR